jgi:hypothetical protein
MLHDLTYNLRTTYHFIDSTKIYRKNVILLALSNITIENLQWPAI